MYRTLLAESSFFSLLLRCDEDLARQAREQGCDCGGVLHSARYPRKPRGGPVDLDPAYGWRLSLCCSREGCRRRVTPPSLRFLGRRVFLGAVVVLVSALREGPTPTRVARLRDMVGVSVRTLGRWRRWWRETFVEGRLWRSSQGRFRRPVSAATLPLSLLEVFETPSAQERLVMVLRFLAPLTTSSGSGLPRVRSCPQKMHLDN